MLAAAAVARAVGEFADRPGDVGRARYGGGVAEKGAERGGGGV